MQLTSCWLEELLSLCPAPAVSFGLPKGTDAEIKGEKHILEGKDNCGIIQKHVSYFSVISRNVYERNQWRIGNEDSWERNKQV